MSFHGFTLDSLARTCRLRFETALQQDHPNLTSRDIFCPQQRHDDLSSASERFALWVGNSGAAHSPDDARSLAHRLRVAPAVYNRIGEVLSELEKHLCSLSGPEVTSHSHNGTTHDEGNGGDDADFEDDEDEEFLLELKSLASSSMTQAIWTIRSICDAVTRLFSISRLISQANLPDRYTKAEARADARTGEKFEDSFDRLYVREKCRQQGGQRGEKEDWLTKRLGQAITKRRQAQMYSREHRARIANPASVIDTLPEDQPAHRRSYATHEDASHRRPLTEMSRPSNVHTAASTLHLSKSLPIDDGFDDYMSVSTLATTITSCSADALLTVPALETVADPGEYFECPLCSTMQRFNGQLGWKQHVFEDIRPYICTFEECGMLMFTDKRTWWAHELGTHRRIWSCPICASSDFETRHEFRSHLIGAHETTGTKNSEVLLATCSSPLQYIPARDCTLCDWESRLRLDNQVAADQALTVPQEKFMKHLAQHQEQLAFFCLPRLGTIDADAQGSQDAAGRSLSLNGAYEGTKDPTIGELKMSPFGRELGRREFDQAEHNSALVRTTNEQASLADIQEATATASSETKEDESESSHSVTRTAELLPGPSLSPINMISDTRLQDSDQRARAFRRVLKATSLLDVERRAEKRAVNRELPPRSSTATPEDHSTKDLLFLSIRNISMIKPWGPNNLWTHMPQEDVSRKMAHIWTNEFWGVLPVVFSQVEEASTRPDDVDANLVYTVALMVLATLYADCFQRARPHLENFVYLYQLLLRLMDRPEPSGSERNRVLLHAMARPGLAIPDQVCTTILCTWLDIMRRSATDILASSTKDHDGSVSRKSIAQTVDELPWVDFYKRYQVDFRYMEKIASLECGLKHIQSLYL